MDDGSPPGNGVTIKGIHHALRTEREKQSFKMCVSNTHTIKCRSRSESSSICIRIKMIQGVRKITKDKFYFIKISYKSFANVMANLDKFKNIKIFYIKEIIKFYLPNQVFTIGTGFTSLFFFFFSPFLLSQKMYLHHPGGFYHIFIHSFHSNFTAFMVFAMRTRSGTGCFLSYLPCQ